MCRRCTVWSFDEVNTEVAVQKYTELPNMDGRTECLTMSQCHFFFSLFGNFSQLCCWSLQVYVASLCLKCLFIRLYLYTCRNNIVYTCTPKWPEVDLAQSCSQFPVQNSSIVFQLIWVHVYWKHWEDVWMMMVVDIDVCNEKCTWLNTH